MSVGNISISGSNKLIVSKSKGGSISYKNGQPFEYYDEDTMKFILLEEN